MTKDGQRDRQSANLALRQLGQSVHAKSPEAREEAGQRVLRGLPFGPNGGLPFLRRLTEIM
jgi:hypothetical protein